MIIFIILTAFAVFMLALGLRKLSNCGGDMGADFSDYVWALDLFVGAALLGTEAYYRYPFKLVML